MLTQVRAGALSIRSFQVSRWRLRRTRPLWVFNADLVLRYGWERAFSGEGSDFLGGLTTSGEGGYVEDFGVSLVNAIGRSAHRHTSDVRGAVVRALDRNKLRLGTVNQVLPFRGSEADLLSGELLYHDHGAATAGAGPGGDGCRGCPGRWGS